MLFEAHSINAEHKDLIHDVAYDFYGQRMATCSSDQFVKVRMNYFKVSFYDMVWNDINVGGPQCKHLSHLDFPYLGQNHKVALTTLGNFSSLHHKS